MARPVRVGGRSVSMRYLLLAVLVGGVVSNRVPAGALTDATFSVSPVQGPAGTALRVRSVTPCPPPPSSTGWHARLSVVYSVRSDMGVASQAEFPVAADG